MKVFLYLLIIYSSAVISGCTNPQLKTERDFTDGLCTLYRETGKIKSTFNLFHGLKYGPKTFYNLKGEPICIANFYKGYLDGEVFISTPELTMQRRYYERGHMVWLEEFVCFADNSMGKLCYTIGKNKDTTFVGRLAWNKKTHEIIPYPSGIYVFDNCNDSVKFASDCILDMQIITYDFYDQYHALLYLINADDSINILDTLICSNGKKMVIPIHKRIPCFKAGLNRIRGGIETLELDTVRFIMPKRFVQVVSKNFFVSSPFFL